MKDKRKAYEEILMCCWKNGTGKSFCLDKASQNATYYNEPLKEKEVAMETNNASKQKRSKNSITKKENFFKKIFKRT